MSTEASETKPPTSQPRNQKAVLRTEVPGPRSREIRAREDEHLAPGLQGFALMAGITVESARGSAVTDVDGNTFIDIIGGIGVNGLGHSHPKYVQALQEQIHKVTLGSFTSPPRVELLKQMTAHLPTPELNQVQFYSGGSEAVES